MGSLSSSPDGSCGVGHRWFASGRTGAAWLLVAVLVTVAAGHAASLGGLTAASLLEISSLTSVPAPSVVGCDNFTGTAGASLSVRAATVAAACSNRTWTVHVGTWTIQSNQAASSTTANAVATENTTTVDSTVQAMLLSLNTGGRSGGAVLSHDGASSYLAAVMIDATPDRIELRLVSAGAPTVLRTLNPTFATTNTVRLARTGAALSITLNDAAVGAYTLTSPQLTALGPGARAGVFGGNSSVRFEDFVVTTP